MFLRIGDFEKHFYFESAILKKKNLLQPHENQSKLLGYQGWVEVLMFTAKEYLSVHINLLHKVRGHRELSMYTAYSIIPVVVLQVWRSEINEIILCLQK